MANRVDVPVVNCLFQTEDGRWLKGQTTKLDHSGYYTVKAEWQDIPADLRARWLANMGGYSSTPEYIMAHMEAKKVLVIPQDLAILLPSETKPIPCIWRWKDSLWLPGETPDRFNAGYFWGERTRVVRVVYADQPKKVKKWLNTTLYGVWLAPPFAFIVKPEEQVVAIEPGLGTV